LEEARKAVEEGGNPQWALQLTDLILDSGICQAVRTFISSSYRKEVTEEAPRRSLKQIIIEQKAKTT
jgi:hypothetical protein